MTRSSDYDVRARDVPRDLFPSGRVRFSLGTGSVRVLRARRSACDELRHSGAWDVLVGIKAGELTPQDAHRFMKDRGQGGIAEMRRRLKQSQKKVPTLKRATTSYVKWYKGQDRSPASIKTVDNIAIAILRLIDPKVPVDQIDTEIAQQIGRNLKGNHASPNTRSARMVRLLAILRYAEKKEITAASRTGRLPVWKLLEIDNPSIERTIRVRTASRIEVMKLFAHSAIYQDAYLRSFLHMGLRSSELINTRIVADLDVELWEWTIQARDGWKPKTARSHRTLKVPPEPAELRLSIERYLRHRPPTGPYLFRSATGKPWTYNTLQWDFEHLCDRAGVPYGRAKGGITLHTLRHTCATELVRAGVLETIVAGILGDTIQMISATYVHPTPDDLAAGIARSEPYESGAET